MVGWRRRKQGEKRPTYVHGSSNFTCVIHYGGDFVMSPRMKYTSKRVANFDFVDVDTFSTFTLCEMVEKLIVDAPFAVYWRVPNAALSTASVKPLKTDHDCIAMMNSLPDNRHIHIYMKPVRVVADEEVNEDLEDFNKEEEIYEEDHDDEEKVNEDEIHGAATGQEEAYVNEEEAEVYEDEEIHIDANEEDVAATATKKKKMMILLHQKKNVILLLLKRKLMMLKKKLMLLLLKKKKVILLLKKQLMLLKKKKTLKLQKNLMLVIMNMIGQEMKSAEKRME
ncbi:hypothetical protein V6N13_035194 [Hibiscus sabdariffa]|uniref:PB1-like domain-containing protein n=1 Tax=Hibiscus sabdariffa TaxID=183260 RepID=A0ABR2AGQ6_9ROSI